MQRNLEPQHIQLTEQPLFKKITAASGINYIHKEVDVNEDFNIERT